MTETTLSLAHPARVEMRARRSRKRPFHPRSERETERAGPRGGSLPTLLNTNLAPLQSSPLTASSSEQKHTRVGAPKGMPKLPALWRAVSEGAVFSSRRAPSSAASHPSKGKQLLESRGTRPRCLGVKTSSVKLCNPHSSLESSQIPRRF